MKAPAILWEKKNSLLTWLLCLAHNMNGVLLLLYCVSALLYGADGRDQDETSNNSTAVNSTSSPEFPASFTKAPENSSMMTSETSTPVLSASSSHSTTTAPVSTHRTTTATIPPTKDLTKKGCGVVYLVSGVLILVCTVLLLSTLLLLWKVCQLRQRLKSLSSNGDLISNSEYWMGTARKNKSKPEVEAEQTAVLMSDFSETQEDVGNDNNEDEGGKGEAKENKDGQVGVEKNKEVADAVSSKEFLSGEKKKEMTVTENSLSSKQHEDATDSQSSNAVAASSSSSSEAAEKPKDAV